MGRRSFLSAKGREGALKASFVRGGHLFGSWRTRGTVLAGDCDCMAVGALGDRRNFSQARRCSCQRHSTFPRGDGGEFSRGAGAGGGWRGRRRSGTFERRISALPGRKGWGVIRHFPCQSRFRSLWASSGRPGIEWSRSSGGRSRSSGRQFRLSGGRLRSFL